MSSYRGVELEILDKGQDLSKEEFIPDLPTDGEVLQAKLRPLRNYFDSGGVELEGFGESLSELGSIATRAKKGVEIITTESGMVVADPEAVMAADLIMVSAQEGLETKGRAGVEKRIEILERWSVAKRVGKTYPEEKEDEQVVKQVVDFLDKDPNWMEEKINNLLILTGTWRL
ncbi:hypothetical protein A2Z22_00420 [Candidatus Woesebacteria bacterium RBG_16_34_12]|uniref:Uncharacterized protein n=1 Tax=Candidatus Woesebacteria bacterium RBG_16_34_12 TaxID=1802480 RepID=A0A1F7X9Q2_9BACT|nr:MAG: hypothetical protein A2Z22_00420 [Candidatus Woesebacteria bacterium RBG_16_34_12]